MIRRNGKHRHFELPPQFENVIHLVIQHHPANSGRRRRPRHLRKGCSTRRFEHDRVRPHHPRILHVMQQLLTLGQRVVVGVNDLHFHAQPPRRFLRCSLPAPADNRYRCW